VENTRDLLEKLQRGLLDFVLIEGVFNREAFSTQTILQDAFIPLCNSQNPLAQRTVPIQELLKERLFIREPGSGSRAILENALANYNLKVNDFYKTMELGNIEAIKDLVAQNLGITFLYKQSVLWELKERYLAQIRIPGFSIFHDYSFVTLKNCQYIELYQNFYQISQDSP
jgi:DNA-binding transcriptional LysR family regulator